MNNGEEFRMPTLGDIPKLTENFNNCDWIGDYIPSIQENDVNDLRILIINGEIIGIVNFFNTGSAIGGSMPLYYVSTECTKDKDKITQTFDGLKTPGRLLWAYILREIRLNNNAERFAVYNHAISDSKVYHLKMGMKPAGAIPIARAGRSLKDIVFPIFRGNPKLNSAEIPVNELLNEFDDTYLFYLSNPRIDYSSIDSILNSLPPSERTQPSELHKRTNEDAEENDRKKQRQIGGIKRKNKKTKNKKTKNKRKNKKTKNKRKNKKTNKRKSIIQNLFNN